MLKFIPEVNLIKINEKATLKFSNNLKFNHLGDLSVGDFEIFVSKLAFLKSDFITEIDFALNEKLKDEEYLMIVATDKIKIFGGNNAGLFYALQTLKQIILQTKGMLPLLEISDFPQYEYRGFMLDVGRYFYKVEDVK